MSFTKDIVVLYLVVMVSSSFVTVHGGCTNRLKSEEVNVKGYITVQKSGDIIFKDESSETKFKPMEVPATIPAITPDCTKVLVGSRNNFGDLPIKCGPNEEKIDNECREV